MKILKETNIKIYNRYNTVEKNIKAGTNSFYDGYLDLIEEIVKWVLVKAEFDYEQRETCGGILRNKSIEEYFIFIAGVENYVYEKLKDYTQKVNKHKHDGEKKIQVDTIINYMKIFIAFVSAKGLLGIHDEFEIYTEQYYKNMFCVYEKQNKLLLIEKEKLKNELEKSVNAQKLSKADIEIYKKIAMSAESKIQDIEEENSKLMIQISKLKDIKLHSMEEKLNRTIDLLLELKPAIEENRIIVKAVGSQVGGLINGDGDVNAWIEKARSKNLNE